jgi:hypothetical protein
MKLATITATNTTVRVIAVNGGWTQVEIVATGEVTKVRNGALSDHREEKAAKVAKVAKPAREKIAIEDRKNGKVDPLYLQFYQSYTATLADGSKKRSIDKGDEVAVQMRALTLNGVYAYASSVTQTPVNILCDRFGHLNPGMQRMSLGNMVRKHIKMESEALV